MLDNKNTICTTYVGIPLRYYSERYRNYYKNKIIQYDNKIAEQNKIKNIKNERIILHNDTVSK